MNNKKTQRRKTVSSRLSADMAKASIVAAFLAFMASDVKGQVLTLTETVTPPTCSDVGNGSVTLNASGCTGPYVYFWNGNQITGNTVNNVAPGIYTAEARTVAGLTSDTLYYEDFENVSGWGLETNGSNSWVINSVYMGGSLAGGLVTIPDVPQQPATFGKPNQNYLHPLAVLAEAFGVSNSNYELVTTGAITKIQAVMLQDINTSTFDEVAVSFWRTGGMGGFDLIYSTDGGNNWSVARSYSDNPTTWVEDTWRGTQLAGHTQVRVGFSFDGTAAADPAGLPYFSVDELRIIGESAPNCVATKQVTVTAGNNPPTGGFTYNATGLKTEFATTAIGASGYEWDFGYSNPGYISTDPNPVYTYPEAGIYQVKQITTNACGTDTVTQSVYVYPASVANTDASAGGMVIFPNPATGVINVSLNQPVQSGDVALQIFDLTGRRLYTQSYNSPVTTITITVQDLPAGLYSLQLVTPEGAKGQKLFLKE